MKILIIILALLGGGQSDKNFDPATALVKQIVKGVYDETRVETLATFKEKHPQNHLD
jgi:hypothetical protein